MENGTFDKIVSGINKRLGILAGLICLACSFLMLFDALCRYLLSYGLPFMWELSSYLLLAFVFLGGPYTQLVHGHVKVDFIYSRFSPPVKKVIDMCTSLLSICYLLWLGWLSAKQAVISLLTSETSNLMYWPLFPVKVLVPIGLLLVIIQILTQLFAKSSGRD